MPKLQRRTPQEAERMLLQSGFRFERSKGSHRIYLKEKKGIIIPILCWKDITSKPAPADDIGQKIGI